MLKERQKLWGHWIAANAAAEALGLGTTLAVGYGLVTISAGTDTLPAVLTLLLMTASGAIEGVVVGLLQWHVLRGPFPQIGRVAWTVATLIGALAAWFLGSLPSTMLSGGAEPADPAAYEPAAWVVLLMAAGMGLVLGILLGYPQWRLLRKHVRGAWIWLPANALAWALGMPLIFATIDRVMEIKLLLLAGFAMLLGLAITGAVVGLVHGAALVQLASSAPPGDA